MPKRPTSSGYEEPQGEPTAIELRALILQMLTGATDKRADHWADKVGLVETMPVWANPRSNWRVKAHGSKQDKLAVDTAVEIVRKHHPYARAG